MIKKVLKFGGTSVGTTERIQHVAGIIKKERSRGNKVIAIVSAMAGKTNELVKFSKEISEDFDKLNNSSVFPDIADTITTNLLPFLVSSCINFDTRIILSIEPTDVPPNFKTFFAITYK